MAEDYNGSGNNSWTVVGGEDRDKAELRMALASKPVPTAEQLRAEGSGMTTLGIFLLIAAAVLFIVDNNSGWRLVIFGVIPVQWVALVGGALCLIVGHDNKKVSKQKGISLVRNGSSVECRWTAATAEAKYGIAVNGKWVDADVKSPYTLRDVPENATITLATLNQDGSTTFAGGDRI